MRRSDDNAESLKKRLEFYHRQTKPLCDYYSGKGALPARARVDGSGAAAAVAGVVVLGRQ